MYGWDDKTTGCDDPSVDTVALLMEEVARLEAEVLARETELASAHAAPRRDVPEADADAASYRRMVEQLTAELAAKEEAIVLLLEQSRFYEDATAARRSEWDQVCQWVEEVEQRFADDGRSGPGPADRGDRADEGGPDDSARRHESERRAWEVERRGLEWEVARARELASQRPGGDASGGALAALEAENREYRVRLADLESAASDAAALRERLTSTLSLLDATRAQLRQSEDAPRRAEVEHAAASNSVKDQAAREVLAAETASQASAGAATASAAVDADERIRAFRQHLKELHQREAEERAARSGLSSRLSRIWRHAGSGR